MNFDERDLLSYSERAGFRNIQLEFEAEIKCMNDVPGWQLSWDSFMHSSGNPKIPSLRDALTQVLTPDEAVAFTAHLRPLFDNKQGTSRAASAYLWATK